MHLWVPERRGSSMQRGASGDLGGKIGYGVWVGELVGCWVVCLGCLCGGMRVCGILVACAGGVFGWSVRV